MNQMQVENPAMKSFVRFSQTIAPPWAYGTGFDTMALEMAFGVLHILLKAVLLIALCIGCRSASRQSPYSDTGIYDSVTGDGGEDSDTLTGKQENSQVDAGREYGNFTIDVSLSPVIGTVGIVNWSLDEPILNAQIHFGRDAESFEFTAPSVKSDEGYRSLLLGMKPATTYFFQIEAIGEAGSYVSDVLSITTLEQRTGLPVIDMHDDLRNGVAYGGFILACRPSLRPLLPIDNLDDVSEWAFIFDSDGDYVWWYEVKGIHANCSRVRMSFDGRHMWIGNANVSGNDGSLLRVSMEGLEEQAFDIPRRHHDFAVLPNNHIVYFEREEGASGIGSKEGADIIMTLDPALDERTEIYNVREDFSAEVEEFGTHANAINYVPHADALSISMLNFDTIALISYPRGELISTYGGRMSDFDISWSRQHQHHVLEDRLLVFNNSNELGASSVLEFDLSVTPAQLVHEYISGISSTTFGGVKRIENDHSLVTYSSNGTIHELNSSYEVVREINLDNIGYIVHRKSLYGPPPPFD